MTDLVGLRDLKISELKTAAKSRDVELIVFRIDAGEVLSRLSEQYRHLYKDYRDSLEEENNNKAKSLSINRFKEYLAYLYEKPNLGDWIRGFAYGGVLQSAITLYADTIRIDPDFSRISRTDLNQSCFCLCIR